MHNFIINHSSHFGINFLIKLKNNDSFNHTESIAASANTFVSVEFIITSPANSIVYAFAKASLTGYATDSYSASYFYGEKP
jgi:hypothetical protein